MVGHKTGYFLSYLVSNGYTTRDKIHLVGFSLGAHAVGFAGTEFQALQGGTKIPRVTGKKNSWNQESAIWAIPVPVFPEP